MTWWWLMAAALATARVEVAWKGERAELRIEVPPGHEIAVDAPVALSLAWDERRVALSGLGRDFAGSVPLPPIAGASLDGELSLSICEKATGICTPVAGRLSGQAPPSKKGALALILGPKVAAAHPSPYQTDAQEIANAAFARAAAEDKRVLLDFGAVWCPPCNLLAAEVLDAHPAPDALTDVVLAALDVDDPRSWPLIDRYKVGGYPTLIVADAAGAEIDRLVGYPGREAFLTWLEDAAAKDEPAPDYRTLDPSTVDPARAGEIAWTLAQRGDDAKPWIARAEEGEPTLSLRLARTQVTPTLEDATWLAANAPGRAAEWAYGARSLGDDPEGRRVLRDALRSDLARSDADAADLLYVLAGLVPAEEAPLLYAAAAAAVRAALTGDRERDRGHLTGLATLVERAGDTDGALALLVDAARRWTDEPTFHMAATSLLVRAARHEEARVHSEAALNTAWGDNKLRAAATHCDVLDALGLADEARAVAAAVLAELPEPEEGLAVRSHRYRAQLTERLDPR